MDVLCAAKLSVSLRRPRYLSQSCGAAQSTSMPPPSPATSRLRTEVNNVLGNHIGPSGTLFIGDALVATPAMCGRTMARLSASKYSNS